MKSTYLLNEDSKLEELRTLIKSNLLYLNYKNIVLHVISIKETKNKIPINLNQQLIFHFHEGFFIRIEGKIYSLEINHKLSNKLKKLFQPKKIEFYSYHFKNYSKNNLFATLRKKFKKHIPASLRLPIYYFLRLCYFRVLTNKKKFFDFKSPAASQNLGIKNRQVLKKKIKVFDACLIKKNDYYCASKSEKFITKSLEIIEFKKCILNTRYALISDIKNNFYLDMERWKYSYHTAEFSPKYFKINRKKNNINFINVKTYKLKQKRFFTNVINFYDPLIKNFSHFITEFLPIIIEIEKHSIYNNYSFLLPSNIHSNILDYLNIFTKKNRRLIFLDEHFEVEISNLVQPINFNSIKFHPLKFHNLFKHDYYTNHIDSIAMKYIDKIITNKLSTFSDFIKFMKPNKSFIVRPNGLRNTNNKYINKIIKEFSFKPYNFSELNIFQQAKIFKNSSIICGLTGSEFTNLIFTGPDTKVHILTPGSIILYIYKYWSALNMSKKTFFSSDDLESTTRHKGSTLKLAPGAKKIKYNVYFHILHNFFKKSG